MKSTIIVFIFAFAATSVYARPSALDSEEYTDNNLSDSIPEDNLDEERIDYVQM